MRERIRQLRQNLKLTQSQFGAKVNLSQSQIGALENGTRDITDRVVNDICRVFEVNEKWLREGIGPMYVDPTKELDVDIEVKELGQLYSKLEAKQKKVVKDMIKILLENNEPKE